MAKRGAKIKYRKDYARQAFVACSEGGFTDVKLAKLFKVSKAKLNEWKTEYPEFMDSIRNGKDIWDTSLAENCMLKRITGYKYNEITKEVNEETGKIETSKIVRKEVAGDVKAQIFWLRNRNRERWPDIRLSEASLTVDKGSKDTPDMPEDITAQEAEEMYRDIISG